MNRMEANDMFSILPYRYNNQVSRRVPESRDFLSPFFDDFFRPFFGQSAMGGMKVDVEDKDDHYELTADLPGVSKENLKVDVEDGVMTISAAMNQETEDKESHYVYRERRTGSVSRSFRLDGVREDGITAEFKDGVLKMILPKNVEPEVDTARHIVIE